MKLLDLFCGGGGAGMGYHRAGFDVVGCDLSPQPDYPFLFVQADALAPPFDLSDFDLIHASPPCQAFTRAGHLARAQGGRVSEVDLVGAVRSMLGGHHHVIENVEGAPLSNAIRMCGSSFGLKVRRHCVSAVFPPLGIESPSRWYTPTGRPCVSCWHGGSMNQNEHSNTRLSKRRTPWVSTGYRGQH